MSQTLETSLPWADVMESTTSEKQKGRYTGKHAEIMRAQAKQDFAKLDRLEGEWRIHKKTHSNNRGRMIYVQQGSYINGEWVTVYEEACGDEIEAAKVFAFMTTGEVDEATQARVIGADVFRDAKAKRALAEKMLRQGCGTEEIIAACWSTHRSGMSAETRKGMRIELGIAENFYNQQRRQQR